MKNAFKSFLDHRLILLLIPSILILGTDMPVLKTLIYSLSAILSIVAVSHWLRKVVMYFIDLEELLAVVKASPVACAIVYFSVTLYMSVLAVCAVWWVRG